MNKKLLVVAALLLTNPVAVAQAADSPGQKSKHARPALVLLGQLGINNAEITEFVSYVDQKIDNGKLHIAQQKQFGASFELNYKLSGGVGIKQLELRYAPENSNFEATANREALMVNYKFNY